MKMRKDRIGFACALAFILLSAGRGFCFITPPAVQLPPADRVVDVRNDSELSAAIANMRAGDRIVMHDGNYSGFQILNKNVGTAAKPVVFTAQNSRKAIISTSVSGRNLKLSGSSFIHFYGLRFTRGSTWGVALGPAYNGESGVSGCHDIRIQDCEIDRPKQELMVISGNSYNINVIANYLHHSGYNGNGAAYAEGIYIGNGAGGTDRSHDILIQGNNLAYIGRADSAGTSGYGEAIDVKVQTYNITIVDNLIEHVTCASQAAITVLADDDDYPAGQTNPNILVARNRIHDVRSSGGDGFGIWVAANGISVINNIIWDTTRASLVAANDAGNTTGTLKVYHNTMYGTIRAEACILINYANLQGVVKPVTADVKGNSFDDNSYATGNYFSAASDFMGPITGSADAGGGGGFRIHAQRSFRCY